MKIVNSLKYRLRLFFALKVKTPVVIFQSDDWGMVRAPKNKSFIPIFGEPKIWAYDQLESVDELELLYDVLSNYKDSNDNHPFIEANFIVSNPDFEATKKNDYKRLILTPISQFTELLTTWRKGVNKRLFFPQYHGRLHFNKEKMLQMIQHDSVSRKIFDLHFHGGINNYKKGGLSLHSEYQKWEDGSELPLEELVTWIEEGKIHFYNAFGYYPKSTIAPQYVFTPTTARAFEKTNFEVLQGTNMQMYKANNQIITTHTPTGNQLANHLIAIGRNVKFEPSRGVDKWKYERAIESCKNLIRHNIPIIIDSHRINYVGEFAEEGREELNKLLNDLIGLGCVFLSSVEFAEAINNRGLYKEFGTNKDKKITIYNNTSLTKGIRKKLY